ncbi:uncharacterized protein C1orf185 homolog [Alexandromys fortis]|uniref:uncharacterized protein C1orf185 homolog n=1 Tax=Alexandromys fortis TaxID=100897 RepID=UPI0021535ABE|nr:uncharacterized protein C1orf185 homolog [Microtus fortis]
MEVISTCNFHSSLGDHLVHNSTKKELQKVFMTSLPSDSVGQNSVILFHLMKVILELDSFLLASGSQGWRLLLASALVDRQTGSAQSSCGFIPFCEHSLSLSIAATQFLIIMPFPRHTRIVALLVLRRFCGAVCIGFINFLTYFLAAGAISLGTGFLVFSSALWFLICKRRELFRSPNIKSIDEKLEQRLYKQEAKPQSVFISRNFHTGQPQPQVEHREREAAQMKGTFLFNKLLEGFEIRRADPTPPRLPCGDKGEGEMPSPPTHPLPPAAAVNSKDELCLPDPVDGESPDMLSVEKGSSVTVSVPSSHFSWSMEAANEWFSNDSLEVKTPPEPLLGEPLAEKVLAYLSSVSLEERPRNTTNVTFCGIQKDENTEEMFSQRNTEAGIHNLPCDTE